MDAGQGCPPILQSEGKVTAMLSDSGAALSCWSMLFRVSQKLNN
jgi:hypothetical protein